MYKYNLLAAALVLSVATPALADNTPTRVEIDPQAPLVAGTSVSLKNPPLAALMSGILPLAAAAPAFVLKSSPLTMGLVIAAPILSGVGQLYGGDPWHALATSITGPLFVGAGLGVGVLCAQAVSPNDATVRGAFGVNGMWWAYGLYVAWAMTDAYVTADLTNQTLLKRLGASQP